MSGLQRFISYIYQYDNDEKKENAGFAKVEIRGNVCRMEVHIRNLNMEQPDSTVYLFTRKANSIQAIPVGGIAILRGNGDVRYMFEIEELRSFHVSMEDMEGIFIPIGDTTYLASQWKEGELLQSRFVVVDKNETKNTKETDMSVSKGEMSEAEAIQNEPSPKVESGMEIQATELAEEKFLEEALWEKVFQKLRLKLNICFPFEAEEIECVKMQLRDLQSFPKKYWYIGNNSFLLHGFFNYKHIIMGEMNENGKREYFIGVPGVFANQERIMAAMFGFPEFRTAKNVEYKTGNFGYWYRII